MSQECDDQIWLKDITSLRVELPARGSSTPLTAAYELGRVSNEVRFRLQRLWITQHDDDTNRTIHLWQGENELIRRILDVAVSNTFAAVENARQSWETMFTSEWYAEETVVAIEDLNRYRYDNHDLPIGANEVEHLASFCRPVTELMKEMVVAVLQALPTNQQLAFTLGQKVDELIHPPLCSRLVRVVRPSREFVGWAASLNQPPQQRVHALNVPNQRTQPWPSLDARLAIESLYAEFHEGIPGQSACVPPKWNEGTEIDGIMDDVAACVEFTQCGLVEDPDSGNVETSRLSPRGRRLAVQFGLRLDIQNCHLQSTQMTTHQPLAPRLMALLVHFLNQGVQPTTTAWLSENWRYFAPEKHSLSQASVYTAISKLNQRLRGHGVEIHSGDGGYVIRSKPISTPI